MGVVRDSRKISGHPCIGRIARSSLRQHGFLVVGLFPAHPVANGLNGYILGTHTCNYISFVLLAYFCDVVLLAGIGDYQGVDCQRTEETQEVLASATERQYIERNAHNHQVPVWIRAVPGRHLRSALISFSARDSGQHRPICRARYTLQQFRLSVRLLHG